MMWISAIEPEQVAFFWPRISPFIAASQRRGPSDAPLDALRHACMADESWRLLIFDNATGAAIIRILNGNLHVVAIGGTFEKGWHVEFVDWLKHLAKYFGLAHVTLAGRKGWRRLLAPLGFVDIGGGWLSCPIVREVEP